ncbi:transposase [Streptomyces sp. NBC_01005]|nr:transposase [Streptomyces sp. NBC_01362]WSW02966.1 transposase [Streptomyces sp. NBC_01005]WSW03208.1 transposase [Streptomyces sp. NBC_01005]WTC92472.1 transposase [Streptomyces sp. NBC_01650]WTC92710.1 transposase [Streptomyces sp. NBC_01650]
MPKPYPKEFREDVVRVARNREPGVTLEQIAADFGVHPITLSKWLRRAETDEGKLYPCAVKDVYSGRIVGYGRRGTARRNSGRSR